MFTEFELTAKVPQSGGYFGGAVSIDRNYAIVGAGGLQSSSVGAAYVFTRSGSSWVEQKKLTNSGGRVSDRFGTAVSIDEDYAAVGASGAADAGKVYIYRRSGSNWNEVKQLVPSDLANEYFGQAIFLNGDTLIVGSWGAAYVFRRNGTNWIEEARLTDNATPQTYFGWSVALDGNYAIVGAYATRVGRKIGAGRAYIFQRSGTTWTERAILSASDAGESDSFGWSVSIIDSFALIGAPDASGGGIAKAGAAYIFEGSGSQWQEVYKPEPTQAHSVKAFGTSVSIVTTARLEQYAIIGDRTDFDTAPISGAAYLFKRIGSAWNMIEPKITAGDAGFGDEFGTSVSISGESILIGAPYHSESQYKQGAAYIYTDFQTLDVAEIDVDRWQIYAAILYGIIGGGGGKVFIPGSGVVPVDPEPFRTWMRLSPAKRDSYIALMLRDIANLIDDQEGKEQVKQVATELRRIAAKKLTLFKSELEESRAEMTITKESAEQTESNGELLTGRPL